MFIWNIIVSLFTNFNDYGLPHIPLFIILFLTTLFLQFFALFKGKEIVKFLPIIISVALCVLLEISAWVFMKSYVSLLIVVALTYAVVATIGTILGLVFFHPLFLTFKK